MKKFIILLVALVGMISAMAQWVPQNSGTTANLKSVYFTDVNTGYAVGNDADGIILKTTNGGIDWIILMSVDTLQFYSVFFTDANTGYVTGGGGENPDYPAVILKTTDGGASWNIIFTYTSAPGAPNYITRIFFPSTNTGYALGSIICSSGGSSSFIVKTENAGANWTVDQSVNNYELRSIFFTSVDTGFAVGWWGPGMDWVILKTTNGGIDWTAFNSGIAWNFGYLYSVHFPDENTGYAVGATVFNDSTLILKTTNGGIDWTATNSGIAWIFSLYSVHFPDENTGYAVGAYGFNDSTLILKTTNGGTDWSEQSSGTNNTLNSIFFITADTGYIVGSNGTILKTTNGGLTGLNERDVVSQSLAIIPNPSNDKITISSSTITGNTQLSIFNVSGEKVMERQLTNTETQIDISILPRGVYFVRLQNEKMVEVGKMVKE